MPVSPEDITADSAFAHASLGEGDRQGPCREAGEDEDRGGGNSRCPVMSRVGDAACCFVLRCALCTPLDVSVWGSTLSVPCW